jgi:hypothetical protein
VSIKIVTGELENEPTSGEMDANRLHEREKEVKIMPEEVLKFSKWAFLIHVILGFVFTILYWMPTVSMPILVGAFSAVAGGFSQIVGAACLGLTLGSVFCYMAIEWKQVKIVVIIEVIWLGAALVALTINVMLFLASAALLYIVVGGLFIMFLVVFLKQEGKMK